MMFMQPVQSNTDHNCITMETSMNFVLRVNNITAFNLCCLDFIFSLEDLVSVLKPNINLNYTQRFSSRVTDIAVLPLERLIGCRIQKQLLFILRMARHTLSTLSRQHAETFHYPIIITPLWLHTFELSFKKPKTRTTEDPCFAFRFHTKEFALNYICSHFTTHHTPLSSLAISNYSHKPIFYVPFLDPFSFLARCNGTVICIFHYLQTRTT